MKSKSDFKLHDPKTNEQRTTGTEDMKIVDMPSPSESLRSALELQRSTITDSIKALAMPSISESLRSAMVQQSAITDSMKAVAMPSISESLRSALELQRSTITDSIKALAMPSISESLRSAMVQQSAIADAIKALAIPSISESLRSALELQRSTIADAMRAVAIPNISVTLRSALESQNKNIADALKVTKRTSVLDDRLFSSIVDTGLRKMAKAIAEASNLSHAQSLLNWKLNSTMEEMARKIVASSIYNSSKKTVLDSSFLTAALDWSNSPIGKEMASVINIQNVDNSVIGNVLELNEAVTAQPSNCNNNKTIFEKFHALPPFVQQIIIWVFCEVLLGLLADAGKEHILAIINKTKSYESSLFDAPPITKKEIISSNPEIDWKDLTHFRLISGENVRLRVKPSMKSDVIEVLNKNTAIAVIDSTNRQWLYVQVIFHGEKIFGWVNRSYTKRIGL
ncbi:hypothetical protein B4923_18020 [Brenneria roseae subsp. americana]|uniref:SH3b domain-containing protein n=1 Tax=Brenneria roseae subsp. americana TaxID=1508507 RepID=A0A2U1TKU3_9GAMM|nr:SH3 domain-containing protein [Brenneria roseae]PWC10030.1 hypothetical protein B4923_18020 [Brenneria roseae subsp. americana]